MMTSSITRRLDLSGLTDDGSLLRASVDPVTGGIGTSPTRRFSCEVYQSLED
jgi:hypothetical protein